MEQAPAWVESESIRQHIDDSERHGDTGDSCSRNRVGDLLEAAVLDLAERGGVNCRQLGARRQGKVPAGKHCPSAGRRQGSRSGSWTARPVTSSAHAVQVPAPVSKYHPGRRTSGTGQACMRSRARRCRRRCGLSMRWHRRPSGRGSQLTCVRAREESLRSLGWNPIQDGQLDFTINGHE